MNAFLVTAFGVVLAAVLSGIAWIGRLILSRLTDITGRLAKQEFILTGVDEINGVRGDVKELSEAVRKQGEDISDIKRRLHDQATVQHSRLGEWSEWRDKTDVRLGSLEKRPRQKRKQSAA